MADVGQVLAGRYKLVELLGQGGMATIFRGHDTQLGRDVAVKVLRAEYGRDPAFVARFRQEAQAAAALSHPNVVQVFDYGMEAGDPFIVMEMIDGGDLAAVVRERGPFEPLAAARIAQQIYEALDAAHGRGIVHRDIKPTNVLLTSAGRVKVADFGIARAFSEAQLTMPGTTLGSVHYFSPEQARGEMVTSASDVYSAGLVLFEMLTGKRAWTGDSAGAVAVARLAGDPPPPSSLRRGVPQILDICVRRALARVPADRPTAGDMAGLLGRYIADPAGATALPAAPLEAAATGAVVGAAAMASPSLEPDTGVSNGTQPPMPPYGRQQTYAGTAPGSIRRGAGARQIAFEDELDEEEPQGAGAWGWIAAVLGVLVLFAGGVLLFLLLSGRGPQATPAPSGVAVTVPSVVGMTLDQARQVASSKGLILTVGAYQVTDTAAEGIIIAQDPTSDGQIERGSELSVTIATQRQTVAVPDLRLRTEAQAFELLAQFNLAPGLRTEAYDPQVPATLVIGTSPRAGIEVARGTAIDYVVSLGPQPTASPSPTPSPSPAITPAPTATPTPTPPPTAPPTAPPTDPPPPTPAPVTVGNYATCESLGQATQEIQTAGLVVGYVFPNPESGDPNSQVAQQYPAPGTQVPPGTQVYLYVKGPADSCP